MVGEHLTFEVLGHPEPAGSKRAVPTARDWRTRPGVRWKVLDDNENAEGWKKLVAVTAKGAMLRARRPLIEGPVYVEMTFTRVRPKSHLRKGGELSLEGTRHDYPATKPDVLKLARAVEDACTGEVWRDDAQIVKEVLRKVWGEVEGVSVTVIEL